MKLVYVVDATTYPALAPQLEALDRALNAFALLDADARAEKVRATLQERGIVPVVLAEDRENALRSSAARTLLAKTHLDVAETRAFRDYLGDLPEELGASARMILLEA